VENGSNINEVTSGGKSPLTYAKESLDEDSPLIEYLESLGAVELGPDL